MTVLADALRSAGFSTATERLARLARKIAATDWPITPPVAWTDHVAALRLKEVALSAVKSNPRNWDGARDALFKAVRADPSLLWEMVAPFRNQAAQMVLTAAATEMRREELARQGQGAGHTRSDYQAGHARPSTNAPAKGQGGSGHRGAGNHEQIAGAAAITAAVKRSLLDTFLVNGQPIGNLTPREADAWAASRERDARFVRRLTENLPPDQPIRAFRTAEDAERIYQDAEATHA
ncbi:hypothetical protein [Falsiroseomonas tokyonensis]|uniref:Uncharacterized protein n=1 Tax=Falsiroseomonas tokyonensis TaxID=430521 RepID=A0ABV7BYZ3_9PROT|nr:hypothetical protein [Falsiroseomonas tokyonensis]MBU8540860.1 hypothetical protein [Falsiroseomonas tokyonensis]